MTKRQNVLFMILSFGIYAIYAYAMIPLYISMCSNVIYADTRLPEVISTFNTVLELFVYWLSTAFVIYSIFRFGFSQSITYPVIYLCAAAFKYISVFLMTGVMSGEFEKSGIKSLIIYILLEILRMAITVGLSVYLARKYKYTDPREREPLFPFKKLVTLSNPVQATAFFSAFMISLARIISRIRYDIFYGAPQSFAEAMIMIGYYLLDIAIGFIGYFAIVFIILTLEKHCQKEKE